MSAALFGFVGWRTAIGRFETWCAMFWTPDRICDRSATRIARREFRTVRVKVSRTARRQSHWYNGIWYRPGSSAHSR
jgi:hypothetical protein